MIPLARAVSRGLSTGEPMPVAYNTLEKARIRFRRGGVSMIAGQPGSNKTAFMLNLICRWQVPTLVFSNDSDQFTVASRLLARKLQKDSRDLEEPLRDYPAEAAEALEEFGFIHWSFDSSPTIDDIELEVQAFKELYGEYPKCIVVDILMKVATEEGEDSALSTVMGFLDHLARITKACVLVLHHATEGVQGNPCQPRSAVLYKVNQLPVLILTVARVGDMFYVAPVKNRSGPDDFTGNTSYPFNINLSTCTITDIEWSQARDHAAAV